MNYTEVAKSPEEPMCLSKKIGYPVAMKIHYFPPARLDLLEEILIRLSQLVTDIPEIVKLDINP
jgi:hypothetical protein